MIETNEYGQPRILPGASCPGGILVRDIEKRTQAEREADEAKLKQQAARAKR